MIVFISTISVILLKIFINFNTWLSSLQLLSHLLTYAIWHIFCCLRIYILYNLSRLLSVISQGKQNNNGGIKSRCQIFILILSTSIDSLTLMKYLLQIPWETLFCYRFCLTILWWLIHIAEGKPFLRFWITLPFHFVALILSMLCDCCIVLFFNNEMNTYF